MSSLFEDLLQARGLVGEARDAFLNPSYDQRHDPFLLPDMHKAVDRLVKARQKQEKITIYGDYDIDGLTATTILLDSFESFGFKQVDAFIPNRFVEGYGLTTDAVEKIAATGANLIITVDCGSLSTKEIERAGELGVDVIVTDHHNVQPIQPPAVAVINPKRLLQDYPDRYDGLILKSDYTAPVGPVASTGGARRGNARFDSGPQAQGEVGVDRATGPVSSDLRAISGIANSDDGSGDTVAQLSNRSKYDSLELKQDVYVGPVVESAPDFLQPAVAKSGAAPLDATHADRATGPVPSDYAPELYPFLDLAGCGVAFKLVQAMQTKLDGLPRGQEKWLLDLVALGTVCDVVTLVDENRANVFYGLKVLAKTRRPGLKALMSVAGVRPLDINARHLGFSLGPRMNAAGRLETAQYALDMLRTKDPQVALEKARQLDVMNQERRAQQDRILKEAMEQARQYQDDNVLVVSGKNWSHGIIGIVAARLLEEFKKPTYVLEEMGEEAKGSARSYGDFSAADAIRASDDIITKGGGHKLAAGVTLPVENIAKFRRRVNDFYKSLELSNQADLLLPRADVQAHLSQVNEEFIKAIANLEPFGSGNPEPILSTSGLTVINIRYMGADNQHIKILVSDQQTKLEMLCFNAPKEYQVSPGDKVTVWYQPSVNEWQGRRSVEGRLLHLEIENKVY